jgi:hypothetical protein
MPLTVATSSRTETRRCYVHMNDRSSTGTEVGGSVVDAHGMLSGVHTAKRSDQVYVFRIEDAEADGWSAEAAVRAPGRQEALRELRARGLRKSQIANESRPVRTDDPSSFDVILDVPGAVARRRLDDSGWTPWRSSGPGESLNWRVGPK